MSSFYGNGISKKQVENIIDNDESIKNHVIISKTQPSTQKVGDIWLVLTEDSDTQESNNNG